MVLPLPRQAGFPRLTDAELADPSGASVEAAIDVLEEETACRFRL